MVIESSLELFGEKTGDRNRTKKDTKQTEDTLFSWDLGFLKFSKDSEGIFKASEMIWLH